MAVEGHITNPLGAHGLTATPVGVRKESFKSSTTVTATEAAPKCVSIGTDSRVVACATDATASLAIGIATKGADAANGLVEVVTGGVVTAVPVAGAVAAGDVLKRSVTTTGSLSATATPAVGEAFAVALAASASNVATVYVCKSLA